MGNAARDGVSRARNSCAAPRNRSPLRRIAERRSMTAIAELNTPYAARDRQSRNRAMVRGWLYVVLLVMFALFLVGGATRLSNAGLSITEWKPIHGVVPPLTDAEWQE